MSNEKDVSDAENSTIAPMLLETDEDSKKKEKRVNMMKDECDTKNK